VKKATYFALDIICAAACYYFAGWHGLIAYAAVWVAGFGITVTVHLTFWYYGDSAFNLLALSARQRSNVFQLNALSP